MSTEAWAREALRQWLVSDRAPHPGDGDEAAALVAAAEEQGLAALFLKALPAEGGAAWPADVRDRLRGRQQWLLARGVRQLDLLARVGEMLEREGLRALPLKGAALALAGHVDVADRPMADVDVLVLDSWEEAFRTLQAAGYQEVARADHAAALLDPLGAGVVELHWSVTSCPGLFPAVAGVWERAAAAPLGGRAPSAEDLLVHLAMHAAFQHGLVLSLVQWLDFRRVLEAPRPPDLDQTREIARSAGAGTALALALEAASLLVGVAVPDALVPRRRLQDVDTATLMVPARPRLARRRWESAAGRRADLVRGTFLPATPGSSGSTWSQAALAWRRVRAVWPHLRRPSDLP